MSDGDREYLILVVPGLDHYDSRFSSLCPGYEPMEASIASSPPSSLTGALSPTSEAPRLTRPLPSLVVNDGRGLHLDAGNDNNDHDEDHHHYLGMHDRHSRMFEAGAPTTANPSHSRQRLHETSTTTLAPNTHASSASSSSSAAPTQMLNENGLAYHIAPSPSGTCDLEGEDLEVHVMVVSLERLQEPNVMAHLIDTSAVYTLKLG